MQCQYSTGMARFMVHNMCSVSTVLVWHSSWYITCAQCQYSTGMAWFMVHNMCSVSTVLVWHGSWYTTCAVSVQYWYGTVHGTKHVQCQYSTGMARFMVHNMCSVGMAPSLQVRHVRHSALQYITTFQQEQQLPKLVSTDVIPVRQLAVNSTFSNYTTTHSNYPEKAEQLHQFLLASKSMVHKRLRHSHQKQLPALPTLL